jgi:hypothetical protein
LRDNYRVKHLSEERADARAKRDGALDEEIRKKKKREER